MGFVFEILQHNGKVGEPGFPTHITPAKVRHTLRIYDNDMNLVLDFFLRGGDSGSAGNERHPVSDSKLKSGSLSASSSEELHPSIQSLKSSSRKGTRLSKDMSHYDDLDGNGSVKKVGGRNRSCNHGGYKCSTSEFVLIKDVGLQQANNSSEVKILRGRSLSDENWLDSSPLSEDIDEMQVMGVKSELTMVVVGHVDAGKSTLIGNLLFQSGNVRKNLFHKFEKDGSKGNGSFHLAWVMDNDMSEREHGVTISVAERVLFTKNKKIVILDTPGHKDFIPNMINGATQADVALLVVPASTGEYESSMMVDSQTQEHAILLKALGVNQIVVVVNKMDLCQWSESRFRFIENEVRRLLQSLQFRTKLMQFLPARYRRYVYECLSDKLIQSMPLYIFNLNFVMCGSDFSSISAGY